MPTMYLIIIAILGWGVGSLFYKLAGNYMHPMMVTTTVTALYVILTPLAFLFLKFPKDINVAGVAYAAAAGLCMAIGSMGYLFALKKGDAGEITTITALYPALTLLLSVIFLSEGMTIKKGIGIALALLSCIILSLK
jgi:transporter family protein